MAIYVFNNFKDFLAHGYIQLLDATRDGSSITGDDTHNPLPGVFRVCLIEGSASLGAFSHRGDPRLEGRGGADGGRSSSYRHWEKRHDPAAFRE